MTAAGSYRVTVGSQHADLPIVPLDDGLAIALMMTIDLGVRFTSAAAAELASALTARPHPCPGRPRDRDHGFAVVLATPIP